MRQGSINSFEDIWRLASGFMSSRAVLSAFELGIFSALGVEGASSGRVAEELGLDARAADRLMSACTALGLLEKSGDIYRNTELAQRHLDEKGAEYIGGLGHLLQLWGSWHTLTDAVKAGGAVEGRAAGPRDTESFIAAMHNRAVQNAPKVAAALDLNGVYRVLDLGGGSGAYGMELCKSKEGLIATVLDTPDVIPLTRRYVAAAGLEDRVDYIEGDFTKDEYGSGYDLILLSSIMHIYSADQNTRTLKRCAKALNPGGRAVIKDFVVDPGRTSPIWPVLFALNMLVNTEAGDTYTQKEMFSWLAQAGFGSQKYMAMDDNTGLIIGYIN